MPLALLAFVVSVAYNPAILSAAVAPRWWVILVFAPLVLMTAPRVRVTEQHWRGLAVLAVAGASLLWSISRLDTLTGIFQLAALAMVFCTAAEQEDLAPVWLAFGFGMAVNTVVALIQYHAHNTLVGIGGLFYHQDYFGGFAAVALVGLLTCRVRGHFALLGTLVAIAGLGLVLASARGAYLGAVAGILAWGLVGVAPRKAALYGLALAAAGVLIFGAVSGLDPYRIWPLFARWTEWRWIAINLRPFGWGFNTLGSVFPFEHADNNYLELVFDLGAFALVPFYFLATALKDARHDPTSFAVLCTIAVNALASSPFSMPATVFAAAVAFGGLCGSGARLQRYGLVGAKPDQAAFGYHHGVQCAPGL